MGTDEEKRNVIPFDPFSYTEHFYPVDEVLSCLQKAVRRGQADAAAFWAGELHVSRLGATAMHRMQIMAVEDVGIAAPESVEVVATVRNQYLKAVVTSKTADDEQAADDDACRICMACAVFLAKKPKTRTSCILISWMQATFHCLYDRFCDNKDAGYRQRAEVMNSGKNMKDGKPQQPVISEDAEVMNRMTVNANVDEQVENEKTDEQLAFEHTEQFRKNYDALVKAACHSPDPLQPLTTRLANFQKWLRDNVPRNAMLSSGLSGTPTPEELHIEREFLQREQVIFLSVYTCLARNGASENDTEHRDQLMSVLIRSIPKAKVRNYAQTLQRLSRREMQTCAKMSLNQILLFTTRWPWVLPSDGGKTNVEEAKGAGRTMLQELLHADGEMQLNLNV